MFKDLRMYASSCSLDRLAGRTVGIPGINILSVAESVPQRDFRFRFRSVPSLLSSPWPWAGAVLKLDGGIGWSPLFLAREALMLAINSMLGNLFRSPGC